MSTALAPALDSLYPIGYTGSVTDASRPVRPVLLCIVTKEVPELHAGDAMRAVTAQFGGRGGGSATMAEGTIPNEEDVPRFHAAVAALVDKIVLERGKR